MISLTILGNNSAIPAFNRHPTAQILHSANNYFLIDCGEGTQLQLKKYNFKKSKINHIFISHLHGDHYFGLIGLLSSMSLLGRTQDLHLYAPAALKNILDIQLEAANSNLCYNLHFHSLTKEEIIFEDNKNIVKCFSVNHRIECWGFIFTQKNNPRKLDMSRINSYEIPAIFYNKLLLGFDYVTKKGTIIPNEEVTIAEKKPSTYAYCADTIFDETLADKVFGVDLLYHETTYLNNASQKAFDRFHSTTIQAGNIAKLAQVGKLIIGHFSSRYELLDDFLTETKAVFENTELAIEGVCFEV